MFLIVRFFSESLDYFCQMNYQSFDEFAIFGHQLCFSLNNALSKSQTNYVFLVLVLITEYESTFISLGGSNYWLFYHSFECLVST